MTRMIRKQIYITAEQQHRLKARAKKRGVPEAVLIREGIADALKEAVSLPLNLSAWEKEQEFIEARRRMVVPQTGRTWTREDLYDDERFRRYSD